ncbi:SMP-30/gluconolactonase/LRE family protein [Halalkalibaculum sp. DA3122]|uniref:SMP-30/gluconolactonase/LRE family protein n=1 Tax=Halalkalibaculum sp. DA3122 TaxID=3373607 RepID=UPI0037541A94
MTILFVLIGNMVVSAQPVVAEGAEPEIVTEGYQFTEGPLWHPDGYLLFSDIPANTIYRWIPGEGAEVFVKPSDNSNGLALDVSGNIVMVQHAGKLSRLTYNGNTMETVVDSYNGMRLNSPNDLAVHSNGTIFFTDPPFGVSEEEKELDFNGVYMLKPDGTLTVFYKEFSHPNGVVLSPDEQKLYVNNSSSGEIVVFDINNSGKPVNPRSFASVGERNNEGAADGMKVDADGRVYSTGPGGVYVFDSEGNQIQKIETESRITNLAWGEAGNSTLFMTAPSAVYRLEMAVSGR